jgi:uncharacterized protein YdcH (DUF465 family)
LQIAQKDLHITELLTKYDKLLNRINRFEGEDSQTNEKNSQERLKDICLEEMLTI